MGNMYSHTTFETNKYDKETNTICFNMDIFENNILSIFYKIILKIENIFDVKCKTFMNDHFTTIIHTHFEIQNCLLEIKLTKQDKIYSHGFVQIRLKLFAQKYNIINKNKFYELCSQVSTLC